MSTTVHLSPTLLQSVDRRAREVGVSRNRYIIQALQRALETDTRWSSSFVKALNAARADGDGRRAIEEMAAQISSNRTRKAPPLL